MTNGKGTHLVSGLSKGSQLPKWQGARSCGWATSRTLYPRDWAVGHRLWLVKGSFHQQGQGPTRGPIRVAKRQAQRKSWRQVTRYVESSSRRWAWCPAGGQGCRQIILQLNSDRDWGHWAQECKQGSQRRLVKGREKRNNVHVGVTQGTLSWMMMKAMANMNSYFSYSYRHCPLPHLKELKISTSLVKGFLSTDFSKNG